MTMSLNSIKTDRNVSVYRLHFAQKSDPNQFDAHGPVTVSLTVTVTVHMISCRMLHFGNMN